MFLDLLPNLLSLSVQNMKLTANIVICRILSMYDIKDEDVDNVNASQQLVMGQSVPLELQLPVLELMKVLLLLLHSY